MALEVTEEWVKKKANLTGDELGKKIHCKKF